MDTTINNRTSWQAWAVWSIAALFVLFQFLLQASTSVMIPCLEKAFSVSIVAVGLLSSSFFFTYLVLQIPAGIVVDKYGPRRLLTVSVLITAAASFMFANSHYFSTAEASRMLMGIVTAPAVPAALYLAAKWFPPRRFALVAGLTEMTGMIGGAIGERFLSQCVQGSLGWRGTMYLCAKIAIVLAILIWFVVRDKPKQAQIAESSNAKQCNVWQHLLQVIRIPQVWWNGLFSGFTFAIIAAFAALWAVPFLQQVYGLTLVHAAQMSSILFIGTALGTPVFGWLSDRIGRRKPIMFFGSIVSAITMISILYIPELPLPLMNALFFILGFSVGCYAIAFAVVREITPPEVHGTAMGFTNMMCILIGAPVLQPVIGWLIHFNASKELATATINYGNTDYRIALSALPIALVLSIVNVFFIKETYCSSPYELAST